MPRFASLTLTLILVSVGSWAAEYAIDPVHSHALFRVKHLGASYSYGLIPHPEGTLHFDPDNVENSSIEVTLKPAEIATFDERRDQHLAGPDFFSSKEFPTLTFKSTSWKETGDDTYEVTGDLTIRGVTKEITAEVHQVGSGKHPRSGAELIGFHTEFDIDRTEFDMNYGVTPNDSGLGKMVHIIFAIEAATT